MSVGLLPLDVGVLSEVLPGVIGAVAGYVIGSVSFAYIIAKQAKGIDIRDHGSGNAGATNVGRVVGKRAGQLCLLLDFLKALVPVVIVQQFVFPEHLWSHVILAIAIVVGHSKSMFLNFTGGKSAATGLGSVVALCPIAGILVGVVAAAVTFSSRYVSVGSMVAALSAPILFLLFQAPFPYLCFAVITGLFVVIKHKANIQRLLQGTENRLS